MLIVSALYLGRELIIPFVIAAILVFLLAPVVRLVERLRIGRALSVLTVLLATASLLVGTGWLLTSQTTRLIADLPRYEHNLTAKANALAGRFRDGMNRVQSLARSTRRTAAVEGNLDPEKPLQSVAPFPNPWWPLPGAARESKQAAATVDETQAQPVKVEVVSGERDYLSMLGLLITPVVHPLITLGVVTMLLGIFLVYREDLRDRVLRLAGKAHLQVTTATLADIGRRLTRYFSALLLSNLLVATVIAIGLSLFGIPNALLWGLLTAMLRFIPYLGLTLAALLPATLAAAMFDGWLQPALVVVLMISTDMACSTIVEPWLFGDRIGAAPPALLISFVFWTWLWGGVGLLLATPISACLVVLGRQIPAFEILFLMLGREPVLEPPLRLYQRLLSGDDQRARDLLKRARKEAGLLGALDELLLPALALLEADHLEQLVDRAVIDKAREVSLRFLEDAEPLEEARSRNAAEAPAAGGSTWFILPDRGSFDDLLPRMLERVRPRSGRWTIIPEAALASEVIERAADVERATLVVLALEPRNLDRIRLILKRLAVAGLTPDVHIGLFSASPRGRLLRHGLRQFRQARISDSLSAFQERLYGKNPSLTASRSTSKKVDVER